LASGLASAVDRAVRRHDESVPSSRWWPVLGLLQSLTTVALILSVAWVVIWILARPPVDDAVLPLVGRIPIPFVALVVTVIAGYVLGRGLGIHAGWLGRRWARRLAASVRESVEREVADGAFGPLDRLEAARRSLWLAARATRDDCGRG
ncbi:MAG: hypothetical protein H0V74_09630, partial [Chloroflexi bacterium]|nr:hypothetical protein [Chloroflexota bacterium]